MLKRSLYLLFLSLFFVPLFSLEAQSRNESYRITSVDIAGTSRVDTAAVVAQLKHTEGVVTSSQISDEIKAIYRTGFFDQVTAEIVKEKEKTILRYVVIEKPVVRKVFIQGNEDVSEDDLSEIITLGSRRFLDKATIHGLIRNATMYYQGRGYYDVSFDHSVTPLGENEVDLTFIVKEGDRYKINEIEIRGLNEIDEDDLIDVMQTQEYSWWSSWIMGTGRLNKDMLENDRRLIRQYFLDNGYLDATISEPVVHKEDARIQIYFDATEGTQYSIGEITVDGDLINESDEETLDGIESETGEVFNASIIREDSFHISDKFTDIGYAFANVTPNTAVNRELANVDLKFSVDKGKPVTVNRIKIRGNDKTYDNVIRREMRIDEQALYSGSRIKKSEAFLERTGYFEEVGISTEPVLDEDDKVNLLVNVREGPTGSFSAGAGYSSSDGALINTRISENNLFGAGKSVDLNVDLGDERNNFILSYTDRRFQDSFLSLGASGIIAEREFTDFDRNTTGGGVTFGYPGDQIFSEWAEDIEFSLRYQFLEYEIDNVDPNDAAPLVIESQGKTSASGLTPKVTRSTINNPLNPTEGSLQSLSAEITGLGGNQEYYLIEAKQQLYYPLLKSEYGDLVFSWRTRFGYGETFDDQNFPLFRRYFPGGINSVRGYKNRTLGPKDENGNEYGGSKQLVNNVELIFPLLNSAGVKGVVFYDIGEAFDDDQSIDLGDLREAYGFGIRWISPLGPIRIEFGIPIDRQEGEDSLVTLFSFGAPL